MSTTGKMCDTYHTHTHTPREMYTPKRNEAVETKKGTDRLENYASQDLVDLICSIPLYKFWIWREEKVPLRQQQHQ